MTGAAPLAFVQFLCAPARQTGWTFDLWITAPLFLSGIIYAIGTVRVWRAGIGRGVRVCQVAFYIGGWLALALALVSPVHYWGGQSFTLHMIEHELVMAIAAPLVVLARPGAAFAWAVPACLRPGLGSVLRASGLRGFWRGLSRPGLATVLHGAAIWVWHAPPAFDAAVLSVPLHRLQHVSFLLTGLIFWWALLRCRNRGVGAAHLFVTMLHTSILGALIALAPQVLYALQTSGAAIWGMTPLEDQQRAGILMWIPAGTVYAGAGLWFIGTWVWQSEPRADRLVPDAMLPGGVYREAAE